MPRIHVIVVALLVQTVFTAGIDRNGIRRRRQQQPSASFYGNQNLAGSVPGGYNYGANTNLYGTNLNNQGSKDLYGNPIAAGNTANAVNTMGLVNQQQQQQQQQQQHQQLQHQQQQLQQQQLQQPQQQQPSLYGVNNPAAVNPSYPGANFYSGSGTNPVLRDANTNLNMRDASGNPLPAGSAGSSPYSPSNPQVGYPSNTNQVVSNKDMYNPSPNPTNTNNNNQYGYNVNPYPNSNTYSGQSATNNNNAWSNNQYNSNAGDTWMPNRDLSSNSNTNNNAYSNPNSPYFYNNAAGSRLTSCLMLMSLLFALALLRI